MDIIQRHPGVVRSHASLWAQRDRKLFVSTEGLHLEFDLLAMQGDCTATAVHNGRFAAGRSTLPICVRAMSLCATPTGRVKGRIAEQAVEKVRLRIDAGRYDLVLDPEHLSLTMHESWDIRANWIARRV